MKFMNSVLLLLPASGAFANAGPLVITEDHPVVPSRQPRPVFGHGQVLPFKASYDRIHANHRIPTSRESAILARRMLRKGRHATLSTVFPHPDGEVDGRSGEDGFKTAKDVAGLPIGLVDYYADCTEGGDPVLISFDIGTTFKNTAAGSNLTLSLDWATVLEADVLRSDGHVLPDPHGPSRPPKSHAPSYRNGPHVPPNHRGPPIHDRPENHHGPRPRPHGPPHHGPPHHYSPASLPRFALMGHLELIEIDPLDSKSKDISACYLSSHPDAARWTPGHKIHTTHWAKLVVEKIYWVGGFGNVAYIGWIDGKEWHSITEKEISDARLPGELPPPPHHLSPDHRPHRGCSGSMRSLRGFVTAAFACLHHDGEVCPIPMSVMEGGMVAGWIFFLAALASLPLACLLETRKQAKKVRKVALTGATAEAARKSEVSPPAYADEKDALLAKE